MANKTQEERAKEFLALHQAPPVLILGNAWDVSSAKVFEVEGFKAIGTTSAGIAATLGYPDGQQMSLAETMEVVERIVCHVNIPVSADIEAGYATSIEGVVAAAREVLRVGAVGLNIEDSTGDPAQPFFDPVLQQEKIRAIRAMASAEGIPVVINARTDGYMIDDAAPAVRLRRAIEWGNAYREAGADCIFVPDMGDLDSTTITQLVKEIDAPLNVIAGVNMPPIAELEALGVARVSLGPRHMRVLLTLLRTIAQELLTTGTYEHMRVSTISYADVNQWFAKP